MRTQIALDDEQHAMAKRKAADLGITLAEYIRRLVADDLGETRPSGDLRSILGVGSSGGSDIANDRDQMLADAAEQEFRRRKAH